MTPVPAWAAVAPDGQIDPDRVASDPEYVRQLLWKSEKQDGWRVVRVEIRVMEDGQ